MVGAVIRFIDERENKEYCPVVLYSEGCPSELGKIIQEYFKTASFTLSRTKTYALNVSMLKLQLVAFIHYKMSKYENIPFTSIGMMHERTQYEDSGHTWEYIIYWKNTYRGPLYRAIRGFSMPEIRIVIKYIPHNLNSAEVEEFSFEEFLSLDLKQYEKDRH